MDVDKGGDKTVKAIIEEYGPPVVTAPSSRPGGYHLYYCGRYEGKRNGVPYPGGGSGDLIGGAGYVILWDRTRVMAGWREAYKSGDLVDNSRMAAVLDRAYVRAKRSGGGYAEHGRNCKLFVRLMWGHDEDEAVAEALAAGLPQKEIDAVIRSAKRTRKRDMESGRAKESAKRDGLHYRNSKANPKGDHEDVLDMGEGDGKDEPLFQRLSERKEIVLPLDYCKPKYALEDADGAGIIEEGVIAGISAPGGTGKSRVLLDIILSAASGGKVKPFDYWTAAPATVLYVHGEDHSLSRQNRRHGWAASRGLLDDGHMAVADSVDQNLYVVNLREHNRVNMGIIKPGLPNEAAETGPFFKKLEMALAKLSGHVIVAIDPLIGVMGGVQETNENFASLIYDLRRLQNSRPRTTILLVHHMSKAALNPTHRESLGAYASRGGTTYVDGLRAHLTLRRLSKQEATACAAVDDRFDLDEIEGFKMLESDKPNDTKPVGLILRWHKGGYEGVCTKAQVQRDMAEAKETKKAETEMAEEIFLRAVIQFLEDLADEGCTRKQMIALGDGSLTERKRNTLIAEAIKNGSIRKEGTGQKTRYFLGDTQTKSPKRFDEEEGVSFL